MDVFSSGCQLEAYPATKTLHHLPLVESRTFPPLLFLDGDPAHLLNSDVDLEEEEY